MLENRKNVKGHSSNEKHFPSVPSSFLEAFGRDYNVQVSRLLTAHSRAFIFWSPEIPNPEAVFQWRR